MGNADDYEEMQDLIDEIELKNRAERRTVIKPLYDYFQILLRDVAVIKCGLDENTIKKRRFIVGNPPHFYNFINCICNCFNTPDYRK